MNKTPKVTVLMPVYNGEKYLKEAVDSILNQTFDHFEFLIINDGSTDNSQNIIESYTDPRIRLINHENKGLSETLNIGLELSRGEYIARMDADDISLKNRLKEQLDFMDNNPSIGISGTFATIINKDGKNIGKIVHPLESEEIKAQLLFSTPFVHPSIIFRKSVILENNFKYLNVKSEDYDLWSRITDKVNFGNINKFLIKYRFGVGISENVNKEACILNTNEIIQKNLINLGKFSKNELLLYQKMYDGTHIPDNTFLNETIKLLKKIRLYNNESKKYNSEALNFVITIKWFYVCARMNKIKLLFSTIFWFNSLNLFFKLKLKQKINLIKLANAKLSLTNTN